MAGKYYREDTKSWYISWIADGKNCRERVGRVTEAEAEAARLAKEQSIGVIAAAGPTFAAWVETYATWHAEEYPDSYFRVEQILRQYLAPAFGSTPLLAITRDMVDSYKRTRLQTAAAGTVVKEWRTLQACLNHAVACDVIPHNPVAHVKGPRDLASRPPRWYSKEELARLYATQLEPHPFTTADDRELAPRYRWSWQLLANTGMRRGEALHLEWRDVGKEEIGIRSEPGARTKSGKWRSIPITRGADEALDALRRRQRFVIPQVAPSSLSRTFSHTLNRAALDGSIHCLRHTYCSHLVQAGVPLRTVQVLAGHASYATTERYAHLAPSNLRDSIAGMSL